MEMLLVWKVIAGLDVLRISELSFKPLLFVLSYKCGEIFPLSCPKLRWYLKKKNSKGTLYKRMTKKKLN